MADGEKEMGKENEKIMTFLVATNVVASRPAEGQPTGTPTACANLVFQIQGTSLSLKH